MLGACYHSFVKISAEFNSLVSTGTGYRKIDRHERRIVDFDAAFFIRCLKPEIAGFITFQDRCKQLDHLWPIYGRALIVPYSVTCNTHIDITAENRRTFGITLGILWMLALKSV